MRSLSWLVYSCAMGLGIICWGTSPLQAADPLKEIQPIQAWKGSVEDRELLGKPAPFLVTAEGWKELWTRWKLEGELPKIDFQKDLVIVQTTVGSVLNVSLRLDAKGDLKALGLATRDLRPGFRYSILQISREGITSINEQPLPKLDPKDDKKTTVTGKITGPGDLEEGLVVTVKLVDVSLADAAAKVLGEQTIRDPKAFPIPFEIPYDPKAIGPGFSYAIGVRIEKEGKLKFINDTRIPAINNGPTKDIQAPVIKIN